VIAVAVVVGGIRLAVTIRERFAAKPTMTGSITVQSFRGVQRLTDTECTGRNGYDDIRIGTQVTVTDAAGTIIGTGHLGAGTYDEPYCRWTFAVAGLPTSQFYAVEVSHRGRITKSSTELARIGWNVDLTLG
jgi:hypothetical protein